MCPALSRSLCVMCYTPRAPYPNPLPPDFSRIPHSGGPWPRHFAAWRAPGLLGTASWLLASRELPGGWGWETPGTPPPLAPDPELQAQKRRPRAGAQGEGEPQAGCRPGSWPPGASVPLTLASTCTKLEQGTGPSPSSPAVLGFLARACESAGTPSSPRLAVCRLENVSRRVKRWLVSSGWARWGRKGIEKRHPPTPHPRRPCPGWPEVPRAAGHPRAAVPGQALGSRRGSRTLAVSTLIHPLPGGPRGPSPGRAQGCLWEGAGTVLAVGSPLEPRRRCHWGTWCRALWGGSRKTQAGRARPRAALCLQSSLWVRDLPPTHAHKYPRCGSGRKEAWAKAGRTGELGVRSGRTSGGPG